MKRKSNNKLPNRHMGLVAKSGSGKSSFLKKYPMMVNLKRVVVWDYKNEYNGKEFKKFYTVDSFLAAMKKAGHGNIKAALVCQSLDVAKEFDLFCRIAWAFTSADALLGMVVEELSLVTSASHCPKAFKRCIVTGRSYGLIVAGTTQKPAISNGLLLGQAGIKWVGELDAEHDIKAVSKHMGIPIEKIRDLNQFDYYLKTQKGDETGRTPK